MNHNQTIPLSTLLTTIRLNWSVIGKILLAGIQTGLALSTIIIYDLAWGYLIAGLALSFIMLLLASYSILETCSNLVNFTKGEMLDRVTKGDTFIIVNPQTGDKKEVYIEATINETSPGAQKVENGASARASHTIGF